MQLRRTRLILFCTLFVLLSLIQVPTFAQINEPIVIGDNKVGQVTAANVAPSFQYNATVAETLFVQALTISDGFIPQVIVKRDNVAIQTISNQGGVTVAEGNVDVTPGLYVFEVQGVNGTQGQFVLSLQPGQEQPATPLVANEPTRVEVNASTPQVRYSFNDPAVTTLRLSVDKSTGLGGASVEVRDAQNDNLLALFGFGADGEVVIPTGITHIIISVNYSGEFPTEDVTLLVSTSDEVGVSPEVTAEAVVEACMVTPRNSAVNIRQSNSTQSRILAGLNPSTSLPVTGVVEDENWYQVEGGGFVSTTVVDTSGNCTSLPIVVPPAFTPVATAPPPSTTATVSPPGNGNRDGDAWDDASDQCPDTPGTVDGCPDIDGDGVKDSDDVCPTVGGPASNFGCPLPGANDQDGDGVPDDDDDCPSEPGTVFGCPDSDNDQIPDFIDECPFTPAPSTMLGCPDRDGDQIPDYRDRCPDESGAYMKGGDGCPSPGLILITLQPPSDADGDGFPDIADACPDTPGTVDGCPDSDGDGFPDNRDGCPSRPGVEGSSLGVGCPLDENLDTDGDGIPDVRDGCPSRPGVEGSPFGDGCPLEG